MVFGNATLFMRNPKEQAFTRIIFYRIPFYKPQNRIIFLFFDNIIRHQWMKC